MMKVKQFSYHPLFTVWQMLRLPPQALLVHKGEIFAIASQTLKERFVQLLKSETPEEVVAFDLAIFEKNPKWEYFCRLPASAEISPERLAQFADLEQVFVMVDARIPGLLLKYCLTTPKCLFDRPGLLMPAGCRDLQVVVYNASAADDWFEKYANGN